VPVADRSWLIADLGPTDTRFAIVDPRHPKGRDEAILSTSSATTLVGLV
jgi:hypothetical protein